MGLAERDKLLSDLEARIYAKRFLLIQKRKALETAQKQNHFLVDVKKDYDKYYNELTKQKNEQLYAIEYLNNYINNVIIEEELSDEKIKESKNQQKQILHELKNIRRDLDELTKYN